MSAMAITGKKDGDAPGRQPVLDAALQVTGLVSDTGDRALTQTKNSDDLALAVTKKTKAAITGAGGISGVAALTSGVLAGLGGQPTAVVVSLIAAVTVIVASTILGLATVTQQDVRSRAELAQVNLRMRADVTRLVMQSFDLAADPRRTAPPPTQAAPAHGDLTTIVEHLVGDLEQLLTWAAATRPTGT